LLTENGKIWREKHKIYSYEVDVRGIARPTVLFNYILNSAWNHANFSEFSYEKLLQQDKFWVLSKFLVQFYRFPEWDDEVVIETWGKGVERLYAFRDFIVYSDNEEKLASATSAWLILDKNNLRPQKMDKLAELFPFNRGKDSLNIKLKKLPSLTLHEKSSLHVVEFSDLDVNGHLTASRYMEWILNCFPSEILENRNLKSFDINFIAEARENDTVSIFIKSKDKSEYIYTGSIKRERDRKELCRAEIIW